MRPAVATTIDSSVVAVGPRAASRIALGVIAVGLLLGTGCSSEAAAGPPPIDEPGAIVAAVDALLSTPAGGTAVSPSYDPRVSLAPMIERVDPQVVSVHTTGAVTASSRGMELFGGGGPRAAPQSHGSGFVYSSDGLVVTNHHVVQGAERVTVRMHDGRELPAKVLGSDPGTDLAVVQIDGASGLTAATLGESSGARVGDWVVAIGSPMGLEHTASVGIVSAKGRGSLGLYADSYLDFLQTDADIAPGSSGGPLFDLEGRVIGINTAVGPGAAPGFAIPIDQVKTIIPKLQTSGKVVRGWLGAGGKDEPGRGGAKIGQVFARTPAADGGLQENDVVTKVDGKAIAGFEDLRARIADLEPGHAALLEVQRDGKTMELSVVLTERPLPGELESLQRAPAGSRSPTPTTPPPSSKRVPAGGELRLGVQVRPSEKGLEIARVESGSVAERIGVELGDVLERVNGQAVTDATDVADALRSDADRLRLEVDRAGMKVELGLRLEP